MKVTTEKESETKTESWNPACLLSFAVARSDSQLLWEIVG